MYLSCSTLVCARRDYPHLRDALARIKELGFEAIDLAAFENWQNVDPSQLAADGGAWLDNFAGMLADLHLRVSSINAGTSRPVNDPDPEAFAQVRKEYAALLDLAEKVGCPNITVQPGRMMEGHGFEELFDTAAEHLRELAALGTGRGVTLSVEGHQGSLLETVAAGARMMAALRPAVGFTYDPSHFAMQRIDLRRTEPLLDYAAHVHVRNAAPDRMQETMERGGVDFEWLVAALRERGYDGAVAIEYFNGFDRDFTSVLALRDLLVKLGVEA